MSIQQSSVPWLSPQIFSSMFLKFPWPFPRVQHVSSNSEGHKSSPYLYIILIISPNSVSAIDALYIETKKVD